MQIFLAFALLTAAFFAEPIIEHMPAITKDVRSVIDDFGAGDPKKIIHYKQATATLMKHGFDSAEIKYPIDGFFMATGINARNNEERSLLKRLPNGSSMVVYYDPVNPTIVVMQPTYTTANNKMKDINLPKGGYGPRKKQAAYVPGYGMSSKVTYFRIACIFLGFTFLLTGSKALRSM